MAKATKQKARKEYICNKCKCTINPGDFYFKITEMYSNPKYRCENCKPQRSELTNSEYLSWLYDLQDNLTERYDLQEEFSKDEIIQELENQKDELEARYDNIPEQLQYASAGETIQNRMDSLDSAISDLEALDYPEKEEINKADYDIEEDYQEALEEAEDDYQEALDNYQEEIETIIGGIEE